MKKWLLALALLLAPSAAFAQCTGLAPANTLCGNLTGSPNVPGFYSAAGAITGSGTINYIPFWTSSATLGNGVYLPPAGGTQLYAAPTAVGTGSCLSPSNACTLATACSFRVQVATFLSGPANISLADGTYTTLDANNALCSIFGNEGGSSSVLTTLAGNAVTPTNVILAVPANAIGVEVKDGGETSVTHLEFTGSNGSIGIQNAGQGAVADYNDIYWGAWGTSGVHVSIAGGGFVNVGGTGETMVGNFTSSFHWNPSGGGNLFAGGPSKIPSAISWTGGDWLIVNTGNSTVNLSGWSVTGSGVGGSTGGQAILQGMGIMVTAGNASCTSVMPGTGGCQFLNGFQDTAGDLQSTGTFLTSVMPAPTRAGDIVYNNGSGWWQSVAGCNSANGCALTENSSGVPALAAAGQGLGANTGALISNASVIDTYTPGVVNAVNTTKVGFTLWPRAATVDNIAASTEVYTCSGAPTITLYECGTDVACGTPTTMGAITVVAAGRVYANSTGLSATAISAGDFTAWGVTGTCSALGIVGKAQAHMN